MKKLLLIPLILTGCNKGMTKIHYSKNINKCIENLEHMEHWLMQDYESGRIPRDIAENYAVVLINTRYGLIKKQKKLEKIIDNASEY